MRWVIAFLRFWYDFIIGDDWLIAVGIVAAIALTALIADQGLDAWWVMPLAVVALLAGSLRRALRKASDEAQARERS
jgi:membrane protein implicated in regulation of membrane protease activity